MTITQFLIGLVVVFIILVGGLSQVDFDNSISVALWSFAVVSFYIGAVALGVAVLVMQGGGLP